MSFIAPKEATTWVEGAQSTDFPIQNIPFGQAEVEGIGECLVAAIGDQAVILPLLLKEGLLSEEEFPALYGFYDLDREGLTNLREQLFELLEEKNPELRDNRRLRAKAVVPQAKLKMLVPVPPTGFVDFYSGIHHASNVGQMFRPTMDPLLPNYRHLPVAYNGRPNTVVVSGTDVVRPQGQILPPEGDQPVYAPCKGLDFELEMGVYVSHGQKHGRRITSKAAESYMLGLVICNDWSARDIQRWEYQPLGPFLAKSFATSVSPWVVTMEALAPFKVEGMEQDPPVLPHLRRQGAQHYDIKLEVSLQTAKMSRPQVICRSNMNNLYWSISQQLAHMTSNGTPVEFGDLYATGTISGTKPDEFGSMLELSWKGEKPLVMAETGEERKFLQDGDTVIMRAWGELGCCRIGFGECRGTVLEAIKG